MNSLLQCLLLTLVLDYSLGLDRLTIQNLPPDIESDLINMIHGNLKTKEECDSPQQDDIKFLLYTRKNLHIPIILNPSKPTEVDPHKKTVLIVHGWISGPTYIGIPDLKDAYMNRYDCNLIIVDWSKLAWQPYTTAHCQLPEMGKVVAEFLCLLQRDLNIPFDAVHIIGHSMGGQMVGFIGKHAIDTCGYKVGRITGLDPAGVLYHRRPISERLDASDATFVDVIHTSALMFGYWEECGDVDFYVNCGVVQKGCPDFNITNIENPLVAKVVCSHIRSLYYMAESTNSDNFKAKSCSRCPLLCMPDRPNATYITMGEDCSSTSPRGSYWLPTKMSAPYAEGCSPYPSGCS